MYDFEIHFFTPRTTEGLLQKIQTLTDAPEGKTMHEEPFEFEDQGKFNLICLLENM